MSVKYQPTTEISEFKKSISMSSIILAITAFILGIVNVTSMILYLFYHNGIIELRFLLPITVIGFVVDFMYIFSIIGMSVSIFRISRSENLVSKVSKITAGFLLAGGIFGIFAESFSITLMDNVSISFYLLINILFGFGFLFLRKTFIQFKQLDLFPSDIGFILVYSQIVVFIYNINIAVTRFLDSFTVRSLNIYYSLLIILIILYFFLLSKGFFSLSSKIEQLKDLAALDTSLDEDIIFCEECGFPNQVYSRFCSNCKQKLS